MLEILNIYFKWNCGDRSKILQKLINFCQNFQNGDNEKIYIQYFWLILNKVKGENNGWNNFNK